MAAATTPTTSTIVNRNVTNPITAPITSLRAITATAATTSHAITFLPSVPTAELLRCAGYSSMVSQGYSHRPKRLVKKGELRPPPPGARGGEEERAKSKERLT